MDRQIVYPGQIPLETDLLNSNRFALVGLGKLAAAVLGTNVLVNGLTCVPTSPPSLQVQVNPGEIYSLQNVDGTPYSSLPADTTHAIVKQGLLADGISFACPAPTTGGQSMVYLIQALYQDLDANPVTLPYYNASNPSQGFSGPPNANNQSSGTAQATVRKGVCTVMLKAGLAATTGSQQTPAADPGYTGLCAITVSYGQTTVADTHIAALPNAPFINETLTQKISQATGDGRYALAATTAPAILAAAPPGAVVHFASSTAPTGWLKANGAAISRSVYSSLFGVIGTTYGAGDGSTTFALPDLRGEFIRNWDDGRGIDSGRAAGSWQADDFKSHSHSFGTGRLVSGINEDRYAVGGYDDYGMKTFTYTGGTETRPRNIALLACIKY